MSVIFKVNLNGETRNFPHYWESCIGCCHAATVLREDLRVQIRQAHKNCGFKYLRFHGIFDDDMSVIVRSPIPGVLDEISFYNIDNIFDFLLDTGMKPFVELGFMPSALASGETTCFHYKGNITPPKKYDEWGEFIKTFAQHLLDRYGKEEVSQWFFEVWNEPNLSFFWDGTLNEYFKFYKVTAEALKSVNKCFRVGGPATSVNEWIPEFRNFCEKNNAPLDFITTHHYPHDDALTDFGKNGLESVFKMPTQGEIANMSPEEMERIRDSFLNRINKNDRDILQKMTAKAKDEAGKYPLYYTEWNGAFEFDTNYQAACIAQTIAYNEGFVEGYSWWTVSDIFEEQGLKSAPFRNEWGLVTNYGNPKPSYRMFEILHNSGDRRLDVTGSHRTAEVLALTDNEKTTIIVYNHDIERRDIKAENISLEIVGDFSIITKTVIDETHCNPQKAWEALDSAKYPTKEQLSKITSASVLIWEDIPVCNVIEFIAEPESVTIFVIERGVQ
jgi:xylan 1,4-beta-xylosidase